MIGHDLAATKRHSVELTREPADEAQQQGPHDEARVPHVPVAHQHHPEEQEDDGV